MIPRFKPTLGFDELKACLSIPKKDDVKRFEDAFAGLMGQKYALAFPYGRTGLMFILETLGLKHKEIICPAYTCVVVPHAIVYSNNMPVFVDCEPDGFNMDLDQAEQKITPKTGAIIATSLFGYPVNLDKIDLIRNRHPHVFIIQDCAHSFAPDWNGRDVHKEGTAALFGLNISKILTSVFGGMVTTDDKEFYQKLKTMRDHKLKRSGWLRGFRRLLYFLAIYPSFWRPIYGLVNYLERLGLLDCFVMYYDKKKIDMPQDFMRHMCGIEARVGIAQLPKYQDIVCSRRKYAAYYSQEFHGNKLMKLPKEIESSTHSQIVALIQKRDSVLRAALKMGVQLGVVLEYCIPNMEAYKKKRMDNEFPCASYYADHVINLPVCGKFEEKDARKVVKVLKKVLNVVF